MTREILIERILRLIYNGQPSDDSTITYGLINEYLNDAIAVAAKRNYTESVQLDGISYVNNAFYSTFSDIAITKEDNSVDIYKLSLPQVPVSLGKNEGIATVQFVDNASKRTSITAIPLSMNQVGYIDSMRPIQNKTLFWNEGKSIFVKSGVLLTKYKAKVKMVSGGNSSDLSSVINVPDDYMPVIIEYIKSQLAFEKSRPIDNSNDGVDA